MKRLKLFESFKEDWLNKISDLKKEAEKESLSEIQQFFFDLTDDFDTEGVVINAPDITPIGGKPFLEFKVNFNAIKSSKIEDFMLRLSDVKLRLKEALGFNVKVINTYVIWERIPQDVKILGIEDYKPTFTDILDGKIKRGDERYDNFFNDTITKVVSYRLGITTDIRTRNEISEMLKRDEVLFKFELLIS